MLNIKNRKTSITTTTTIPKSRANYDQYIGVLNFSYIFICIISIGIKFGCM